MYEWGVTIEWLTPVGATNGPLFEDSWPVVRFETKSRIEVSHPMRKTQSVRLFALVAALFLSGASNGALFAQQEATLEQRIKKVMDRPEFAH